MRARSVVALEVVGLSLVLVALWAVFANIERCGYVLGDLARTAPGCRVESDRRLSIAAAASLGAAATTWSAVGLSLVELRARRRP